MLSVPLGWSVNSKRILPEESRRMALYWIAESLTGNLKRPPILPRWSEL
jgi:hypothetical protein